MSLVCYQTSLMGHIALLLKSTMQRTGLNLHNHLVSSFHQIMSRFYGLFVLPLGCHHKIQGHEKNVINNRSLTWMVFPTEYTGAGSSRPHI